MYSCIQNELQKRFIVCVVNQAIKLTKHSCTYMSVTFQHSTGLWMLRWLQLILFCLIVCFP